MTSIINRTNGIKTAVLGLALGTLLAGGCASTNSFPVAAAPQARPVNTQVSLAASDGLGRQVFSPGNTGSVALFRNHEASLAMARAETNENTRLALLKEKSNPTVQVAAQNSVSGNSLANAPELNNDDK